MSEQDMLNAPIYHQTAAYARAHDERGQYQASHLANIACCAMIDQECRAHFDGRWLDTKAIQNVLDAFGPEHTLLVLANTVNHKAYDGRFSPSNRAWAATIAIPADVQQGHFLRFRFVLKTHPTVLDGFITLARHEAQQMQERPSVRRSTAKTETNTNVQNGVILLNGPNCQWYPADPELHAGRLVRNGNTNLEVVRYQYVNGKLVLQEAELQQKSEKLAELDAGLNIDQPPAAEPAQENPKNRPSVREQLNAPSRPGSSEKHRDSKEECL